MADFTEVIKQRDRMCHAMERCEDCPLGKGMPCGVVMETPDIAEDIIMRWASENPEPMPPTWVEWLKDTFCTKDDLRKNFCPKFFGVECDGGTCLACLNTPIPAYIADKLGIKPKEGNKP